MSKTNTGTKDDSQKPMMHLLPMGALFGASQVLTMGAKKYTPNGYKTVPDAKNRYTSALLRHLTSIQEGEEFDEESGLPHIDHITCCALILSWHQKNSTESNLDEETHEAMRRGGK